MISKDYSDSFKRFIALLEENNVKYVIFAGTLLGAVRNNNFLDHDTDTDIAIPVEEMDKVKNIIESSKWKIFGKWRRELSVKEQMGGNLYYKIDIFFIEEDDKNSYLYAYRYNQDTKKWDIEWRMNFPKGIFINRLRYKIRNIDIYIPNQYEEILDYEYGTNWKIPDEKWNDINAPCRDKYYYPIAVVMTTFLRDDIMLKCLPSYDKYPLRIYLLDQGTSTPNKEKFYNIYRKKDHIIEYSDFDIGLSAARNKLLDKVKEPYILLTEDDIELITDPIKLTYKLLENDKLGIIGGMPITMPSGKEEHYEFELELKDKILYYRKTGKYDIVENFFVAKREVFDDIRYDENLKICEHSVTKDTAIIIKDGWNNIKIMPIYKLFPESFNKINRTRYLFDKNSQTKVWTDDGWQKVKGIFRHKIKEKIYSILTNHGYIECTKDHSLIINNKKVKPSELKVGDEIELYPFPKLKNKIAIDVEWAWLLGLFLAEGCYRKDHAQCDIANQDTKILNKAKLILQKFGIDSYIVHNMHKKNHCNYLKMKPFKLIDSYFSCFYLDKEKIIPSFIINFNREGRIAFFNGFHAGDGTKPKKYSNCKIFSQKSQSIVNGLWYLMSDIYDNRSLYTNKNKYGRWFVSNFKKYYTKNKSTIKKIELKKLNDYVYDIETENHHFCGGIGNVNLHNSDFFLRLKQLNKWTVDRTDELSGYHYPMRTAEYKKYRGRGEYEKMFKQKWGIIDIRKDI